MNAADETTLDGQRRAFRDAIELSALLAASEDVHRCYARHLLDVVVARDGRLVVGVFNEELDGVIEELVGSWGFEVAGRAERPHPDTSRLVRRAFWIDVAEQ